MIIFFKGVETTNQISVVHAHPTLTPKEKKHLKAHPKYYLVGSFPNRSE